MNGDLLCGKLVRLSAADPAALGKAFTGWQRDSEYYRLLDNDPNQLWSGKQFQAWFEKDLERKEEFFFTIHRLEDDQLIGFIGLWGIVWNIGDTWVGIGLGDRETWGKGYGTDAMNLVLGYAFRELNLRRVTLFTFEYNLRAIRSYEKCGFVHEGRQRSALLRDGRRWDILVMGVLRQEWEELQSEEQLK